jgi:hypothetical protein
MASKIKDSVWSIFGQGIKLYFTNFGSFLKYMAFPVLGQILGIILILIATYFYAANLPKMIIPGGILDNFLIIFLLLFIITLPGLIILIKAFWDYLVAYGAINSMLDNMLKSGKVYDFRAHIELIERRTPTFASIWVLLAIFAFIGGFPLFWIIAGILGVYFILVFQVFTFEPDKSAWGCFSKSFKIIKGNFARTVLLMALAGALTYCILPELFKFFFNFVNITPVIAIPFNILVTQLPIDEINKMILASHLNYQISSLIIAKYVVGSFVGYIVSSFLLPMRSIIFALWYKNLNKAEMKLDKKILERAEKE